MKPPAVGSASPEFQSTIGGLWLGYLCFVVYGSLVPLDFKLIPVDQALARFAHISLINVGAAGRADWIANGVLYLPVGFLTALTFRGRSIGWLTGVIASASALVFSLALAIGVEFAQIFFPPRTVSLNDLIAESAGATAGVFLALLGGRAFRTLWAIATRTTIESTRWLLWAYAILYVVFSIFPLDFVLSSSELSAKAASRNWGWWLAPSIVAEARWSHLAKLGAEAFMAIPIGLLFASIGRRHLSRHILIAPIVGVGVGVVVELLQFFLISGVSQGVSVLVRAGGICFGVWVFERRDRVNFRSVQVGIRQYSTPLGILYLPLVAGVSGWFSSPWLGLDAAVQRLLTEVNFTPFFYHYFTTEAQALFSLAAVSMLYAPVGALAWAYQWNHRVAIALASMLSTVVETGKLFPILAHPDPTNIFIAGVIAGGTAIALRHWGDGPRPVDSNGHEWDSAAIPRAVVAILAVSLAVVWLSKFPVYRAWLGVALLLYLVTLWRNASLQFTVIAAALPILDLAPFSGRFFLDEFDWMIIVGLAVGYVRLRPAPMPARRRRLATMSAIAIAVLFAMGCWRALWPLQWPDVNAFNSYLSPFNALRVAKGALWAALLLPLVFRAQAAGENLHQRLQTGMVVGLAGTVLFVLWERASFASLLDFSYPYRVSGPISAMHIGGAYLECYLTVAIAYLIAMLVEAKSRLGLTWGSLLLVGAVYAVMVTYSRGGYLALFSVVMVLALAILRRPLSFKRALAVGSLLLVVSSIVAVPIWRGEFAQSRLATVERDFNVRGQHWQTALALRSPDWATIWFGMGVGRFPVTKYLNSETAERSASYQLITESGNHSLRLSAGRPLYMDQMVSMKPNTDYVLKLSARVRRPGDIAMVQLCHKWLLAATDCREFRFLPKAADEWLKVEQPFNSGTLGGDPWYTKRTVKLTLQSGSGAEVSFDDVQLVSKSGEALLNNGSFSNGLDNWNFTSDQHLSWHVKQMAIAVLFDQGVVGLIVMGFVLLAALVRAGQGAWRRDLAHATSLASIGAFIAVGMFDTLIDSPRYLLLLLLICLTALTIDIPRKGEQRRLAVVNN